MLISSMLTQSISTLAAAQLTVSGNAGHVSLVADGGSAVDLANLLSRWFEVTLGSGATASVRASERITGSASSGASLSVAGGGSVEVNATGGASIAGARIR
jgi:hypothetical protein